LADYNRLMENLGVDESFHVRPERS